MKTRAFFRDTRAVGTGLTAAAFTVMSLAGIGLVFDHNHLVYQRDLLKVASDSAGVALTERIRGLDCSDDDAVTNTLTPIARRYILANLPERPRAKAAEEGNLTVNVTPNCATGTVNVQASADLGGVVFGRWLGSNSPRMEAKSGFEQIERLTEVVLAIDITGSMRYPDSAPVMRGVKSAAKELVNILNAGGDGSVAMGVVPWDYRIKLDAATRTRWESNGWAVYPTSRTYPKPYRGGSPATQTLPTKPEAWKGCVDQRSISGNNPPALSVALPAQTPFTMDFYVSKPNHIGQFGSYECLTNHQWWCYNGTPSNGAEKLTNTQPRCEGHLPTVTPLTTDTATVRSAIDALRPIGGYTYSALGVVWGHRLLDHSWRAAWGSQTHPLDPTQQEVQKVLVLLTDGHDNRDVLGHTLANLHRNRACTAAKNAGIKIFTIAASAHYPIEGCSSQADDPSGTYEFDAGASHEDIADAFSSIGRQLKKFRRTY